MVAIEQELSPVCPSCGRRDVEPGASSGWCAECIVERTAARYTEADRERVQHSFKSWHERTATRLDADAATLRQQRHRLRERCRPKRPATSEDPLEIAAEALRALNYIRPSFLKSPTGSQRFEVVSEALRRLSWGPD